MFVKKVCAALLAAVALTAAAACTNGAERGPTPTNEGTAVNPTTGGGPNRDTGGHGGDGGQDGNGTDTETETSDPIGNLIASPDNGDCSFIPGGADLGRSDGLQIAFFALLIGAVPDDLPGLVAITARSDIGPSTSYRSAVSNQTQTIAALPIGSSDLGRRHVVTITVDAPDEVPETEESDNTIRVNVDMPANRPSGATELICSISAA